MDFKSLFNFNFMKRTSNLNEVLAPLLQALTLPIQQFNKFTVEKAVKEGYSCSSMVYRCVNVITSNMVTLDFEVVGPDEQEVENHPVAKLLDNPCPELPPNIVKSIWWKQLELTGSVFIRYLDGPNPELWPLFPDKVRISPSSENGELIRGYHFINNMGVDGNDITLLPDEVIHLRQVDPADGLQGISPLRAAYKHVDIMCEMAEWNYSSFVNRAMSDVVVSMKSDNITSNQISAIRKSIEAQITGSKNARKIIIAPEATSIDRLTQTAVDMDFIEGTKLEREAIAVAYGIPLPVLGIYDNGTFNNVESAKRDMWEDTLVPKADDFCDTMTWFFRRIGMLGEDQKVVFKKSSIKALQRNFTERVKDGVLVQMMLQKAGYENLSAMEEINRRFELGLRLDNLEEAPPVEFDEFGNPKPVSDDKAKDGSKKPAKDEEDKKNDKRSNRSDEGNDFHWRMIDRKRQTYEDKLRRRVKSLFRQELEEMLRTIEKSQRVDLAALQVAVRDSVPDWEEGFNQSYREVIRAFGKRVSIEESRSTINDAEYERQLDDHINGFINMNTGLKIKGIRAKTMTDIERIIKKAIARHAVISEVQQDFMNLDVYLTSEVPLAMRELYKGFTAERALTIARTEVAAASGSGMQKAFLLSGAKYKQWISSRDSNVRDSHGHLDNQTIPVDATFNNGAKFPGDPSAGAGEVINCRCTMVAVLNVGD